MCGIAGIVWSDPTRASGSAELSRALEAIIHRGPDGEGRLVRPGICAGMRRLAIIDLAGGDQPIFNETGDIAILYNGELYNYRELRIDLEKRGHRFATSSDTEVLVHAYEEHGDAFVERLDGMFAFVIWDSARKRALLARDRFGIKPLYLSRTPHGLAFASETKALAAAGWVERRIDPSALGAYIKFSWIPGPQTMWRGVEQLPPAHLVAVEAGVASSPRRYFKHRIGGAKPGRDRREELASLMSAAMKRQVLADVPVGLFLSGGLDSSLIAAVAKQNGLSLPCHCIEFSNEDNALDPYEKDAPHARAVATALGLDLVVHELVPRAIDLLPKLMRHMDDPAGDAAIINTYMIAKAARPTTRVLLSGMGADEIDGGYRRSVAARALTPYYALPRSLRQGAVAAARALGSLGLGDVAARPTLRRLRKAARGMTVDVAALPESFAAWVSDETVELLGVRAPPSLWPKIASSVDLPTPLDPLEACLAFDVDAYLPSHNLLYFDKATMAASVEARVPFLDNALAAFLMQSPPEEKVRGGETKVELRRLGERLLPRSILKRKKTGFGAPIRGWLRGELKPMVNDLLGPASVKSRGLLDPRGVEALLKVHRDDVEDVAYTIWSLLSLEVWCREVMDRPPGG